MNNGPEIKQPPIIWWMVWGALLTGIFVIFFVVGQSTPSEKSVSSDSPVWMVGLAAFAVSTVIRWLILPRLNHVQTAFSAFIVGLALAESSCILGVFVFPEHKVELFTLSVLGILQYAPYFASGFSTGEK